MQIIGIWIVFDHFWAIPDPKSQIWGSSFWPIFFLQNIGMWGVQSDAMWCPVFLRPFQTEGTHSEAQNGEKVIFTAIMDPKSQFLVPHFRPIVFSSKYGHVGCLERCHVIPGLSATLSNAREPTQRLKTAKKSILWPFWTQNPNFSAVLSCWVGPLGLPCDVWALRNLFKPKGPNQWLIMAKKLGFKVQKFVIIHTCEFSDQISHFNRHLLLLFHMPHRAGWG